MVAVDGSGARVFGYGTGGRSWENTATNRIQRHRLDRLESHALTRLSQPGRHATEGARVMRSFRRPGASCSRLISGFARPTARTRSRLVALLTAVLAGGGLLTLVPAARPLRRRRVPHPASR